MLFGTVSRRQGSETEDDHERRTTVHREASRCGFYDEVGAIDEDRLTKLIPPGQQLAGYFVVRKGASTRPSLREIEVFRSMAASPSASGQLPVLFVASLRLRDGAPTQSFQYQCLTAQGGVGGDRGAGRLEVLPCRINNLTMDSSAEYGHIRPSPLGPLGVGGAQLSALQQAFGPVPPPYVSEAEAMLDKGIQTMEDLVSELKMVENTVVRLQVENRCMERLGHYLRRIKKMVPLDEPGMSLLKSVLTQTRPEDQEELCRSIQDKLSKRKGALTRTKDRLKLECDRRCVFTKTVNEVRTSSEMACESNRGNVLSMIVKDQMHAKRRMEQRCQQAKDAPSPSGAGASGAGDATVAWGARRLSLPPLEERYPNAKESWVYSPVQLRLQRPRCKSVDVASLNQPAYNEYLKRVLRAGADAALQESIGADTDGQEQRGTGFREGNGSELGSSLVKSKPGDGTSVRSFRGFSDCPPVQEEEVQACRGGDHGGSERGDKSGRCVSFSPSASPISPSPGGGHNKQDGALKGTGKDSTSTAEAAALPSNGDDHPRVVGNGRRWVDSGHDPWSKAKTIPVLVHTVSRFQLREGEEGVFHLTTCDTARGAPRRTSNRNDDSGDGRSASTNDDALSSEALRMRSKGARKVLKQTQRLLGALRTPASSCHTTSTGSRRRCGSGSTGGHSGFVMHHRGGAGGTGNGGGGGIRSGVDLNSFLGRDEVWRAAGGSRPERLAEVFRCVVPPHIVRIECEILLHESLSGRNGEAGAGMSQSGSWDDFVFAWECLGDGILAGRALRNLWEHTHHDIGGANDASSLERAADDLLSDGLRRALLATHTYRPPGVDQLFVETPKAAKATRRVPRAQCGESDPDNDYDNNNVSKEAFVDLLVAVLCNQAECNLKPGDGTSALEVAGRTPSPKAVAADSPAGIKAGVLRVCALEAVGDLDPGGFKSVLSVAPKNSQCRQAQAMWIEIRQGLRHGRRLCCSRFNVAFTTECDLQVRQALDSKQDPPEWVLKLLGIGTARARDSNGGSSTGEIPASLGQLGNLYVLRLANNTLTGEIPASLGQLGNLQELDLSENMLTGEIPASLGQLGNLLELDLSKNMLTGEIPTSLGQLGNLRTLKLFHIVLVGEIPASLGQLGNLLELDLSHKRLTGEIPASLGQLGNLQKLDLSENMLTGEIPASLGQLGNLQVLCLNGNVLAGHVLTGEIPVSLGQLGNILVLRLTKNKLTGEIPASLGQLGNLQELDLSHNMLIGEIPASLGQLGNLQVLFLVSNKLIGEIPTSLGQLGNLRVLRLSDNNLTGEIPASLGELDNLKELDLRVNNLTGGIPASLRKLGNLNWLDLSNNNLAGKIPPELGELCALRLLSVDFNKLTGDIPADLGKLGALRELWLAGNDLGGAIPAELGKLHNLERIGLSGTQLCRVTANEREAWSKLNSVFGLDGNSDARTMQQRTGKVLGFRDGHYSRRFDGANSLARAEEYFKDLNAYGSTISNRLKVVLVGLPSAGKTSVASRLEGLPADSLPPLEERTVGVEIRRMQLGPGPAGENMTTALDVNLWDFAGQGAYYDSHQMFLTPGALFILVVDMFAYSETSREDALEQWLDILQSRLPGSVVLLLGTHADRFEDEEECTAKVAQFMRDIDVARKRLEHPSPNAPRDSNARIGGRSRPASSKAIREGDSQPLRIIVEPQMLALNLRAVELYEAQGAILVTRVDGGDGNVAATRIIHVNPAWFADLVRRVVDIRLLEPSQQEMVREALKAFASLDSVEELSQQHVDFFQGGEVSREYLKFLWVRDMKLGAASQAAPPLQMTEEDITAMVGSLLDVRFMVRVRDEQGGVVPDRYVIVSCLPAYIGSDLNPEKLLGLETGGAVFSTALHIYGTRFALPGLVPRLLAWCGRGKGRITACWKHGCCFAFKDHLVLLYTSRVASGDPSIECHAMGSTHDEKAGRVLMEVVDELRSLVRDEKYGFPGVRLASTKVVKKPTSSDELHSLADSMRDHMNITFEELARMSETMAGAVSKFLHDGQKKTEIMEARLTRVGHELTDATTRRLQEGQTAMETLLNTQLMGLGREMSPKLSNIAAVANKCLLSLAEKDTPCPRLIIVSEDPSAGSTRSRFSHFRREAMDKLFHRKGQPKASCYRVRFLCAQDLSAASCGEDGQGYKVEIKDWQKWLRKCLPLVQVSLWLLRVGISIVARADILPVDDVIGKLREVAGEEAAAYIQTLDLETLHDAGQSLADRIQEKVEIFSTAYAELVKFVNKEEEKIILNKRPVDPPVAVGPGATVLSDTSTGSRAPIAGGAVGGGSAATAQPASATRAAGEMSFHHDMVLALRQRGEDEPEYAWVRRDNEKKWKNYESRTPPATPALTA
eukprot:g1285.t2